MTKKDELSRYFVGYVARIFAIDYITADALLLLLFINWRFVVSVIVLPRSVLRHFVPPCIAVEGARQWVRSI